MSLASVIGSVIVGLLVASLASAQVVTDEIHISRPGNQLDPSVGGGKVAYTDAAVGNNDIFVYDIATGTDTNITNNPAYENLQDIDDNVVVYNRDDGGLDFNIYAIDTSVGGAPFAVTTDPAIQKQPAISGDRVVWVDYRTGDEDIWTNADWHTGPAGNAAVYVAAGNQEKPAVDGNLVAWEDLPTATIWVHDFASDTTTQIATTISHDPDVDAGRVVYSKRGSDGTFDVYMWTVVSGEMLVSAGPAGTNQTRPKISGNMIVWEDDRNAAAGNGIDLYGSDGVAEKAVKTAPGDQFLQDIDGPDVAFTDNSPASDGLDIWILHAHIGVGAPATLTLSPPDAVNPVGTPHTVTATVTDGSGEPVPNIAVRFTVTGSVNTTGSCTTDSSGMCSFTYGGPALPGADLISAFADTNNNGGPDVGEPAAVPATKAWIPPTSTPGQANGGGQFLNRGGNDKIAFGFSAKNKDGKFVGECSVVDPSTKTTVKCTDATNFVEAGTHATVFGNAMVNGVTTTYRIDVDDLADPGKGKDDFTITTGTGYTVGGVLTAGNIQVH